MSKTKVYIAASYTAHALAEEVAGIEDFYEDTGSLPHHDAVDGCGNNIVHSKCAGCTYEQDALSAYPCNDCWNGDGDGERCYYDGPETPVTSKPFSQDFKEHLARIQNVIAECDKHNAIIRREEWSENDAR